MPGITVSAYSRVTHEELARIHQGEPFTLMVMTYPATSDDREHRLVCVLQPPAGDQRPPLGIK